MQKEIWEKEYRAQRLVTMSDEPQSSVKNFLRWLRKGDNGNRKSQRQGIPLEHLRVLDLGCGNGKNSRYIAGLAESNHVVGIDISTAALDYARQQKEKGLKNIDYIEGNIGGSLPFEDRTFDIALDVTSSNSLSEKERVIFLQEVNRVLKDGGYFFVRALCKDADKNAHHLLKNNPGPEKDTYIMPDIGLTERVFSKSDFIETYAHADSGINLLYVEKETHYSRVVDRLYKRHFWVAYLQKRVS